MRSAAALLALAVANPLAARDSLGVFDDWGAFRDPSAARCYAIAIPQPYRVRSDYTAFASVGTWPTRGVRGQIHLRLSRKLAATPRIMLSISGQRFELAGGGGDAWAKDARMDASIAAAMRSAGSMSVSASDAQGRRFTDRYSLAGAATAMDAAALGCARIRR